MAEVLALFFYFTDEAGSGAGVAAVVFAVIAVGAVAYNKLHNGTFFTDNSGGK